jgi:hypothetical protein
MFIHALPDILLEYDCVLSEIVRIEDTPSAHRLGDDTVRTAIGLILDFPEELLDGGFMHGVPPIASSRDE